MAEFKAKAAGLFAKIFDRPGFRMREKLTAIFVVIKIIPLILIMLIAWNQFRVFGGAVREIAARDSGYALTESAAENIERMSADVAGNLAEFLYGRDADISYLAGLEPSLENYAAFGNANTRRVVMQSEWRISPDGMSWTRIAAPSGNAGGGASSNAENEGYVNGLTYNHRVPDNFEYANVPLYDEIAFIGTDGTETVKYADPASSKKNRPVNPAPADITRRENTYAQSEDYWKGLQKLKPGEIYVSGVIGEYVSSRYTGIYTPKQMIVSKINAELAELSGLPQTKETKGLISRLTRFRDEELPIIGVEYETYEELRDRTVDAVSGAIEQIRSKIEDDGLKDRVAALVSGIGTIVFDPEREAFAGDENPVGVKFEGIVRWAAPVTDGSGGIIGWVSFALNADHIMEFVSHINPTSERYDEISSAAGGNYAFIWDSMCRSIAHPRHQSIVGFDPETGSEAIPWLESSIFDAWINTSGNADYWLGKLNAAAAWNEFYSEWLSAGGIPWREFAAGVPSFDEQSRGKEPAPALTRLGMVALDGRWLNNAPQCTGWMNLTGDGGSGSFFINWNGLDKLTAAAAVPYYTGQYAPSEGNGYSERGFAFVVVGLNADDFTSSVKNTEATIVREINSGTVSTVIQLAVTSLVIIIIVIFVAFIMADFLTGRINALNDGVKRFHAGERRFRFDWEVKDEFGELAASFDLMADSVERSVTTPMAILGNDFKIIYINEFAVSLMNGGGIDEFIGRDYRSCSIYGMRTPCDPIWALEENRDAAVMYVEKHDIWLRGEARRFFNSAGEAVGYIMTSVDMTEISRNRLELEEAVRKAKLAAEYKSNFLARMSHEIRTPMNAIIGMSGIVSHKLSELGGGERVAEINSDVSKIEDSSQNLLILLNDILDVSKIETGEIELHEDEMNFEAFNGAVVNIIKQRCDAKNIDFAAEIDGFDPCAFTADALRLRQVLINLLGNAVKFTPERGKITYKVKNLGRENGETRIFFSVADTGIGMPEDASEYIFDVLEHDAGKTAGTFGGIGLGLPISRAIVNMMGGEIALKTSPGNGSEFSFEISLRERVSGKTPDGALADPTGKFTGKHALVVDDVDINRMVITSLLEDTGLEMDEADDGEEAVKIFSGSPHEYYDIVFMDIQMPKLDGYQATSTIRSLDRPDAKSVPIVAQSANAFKDDIERGRAAGMNAHIAKPVDTDKLVEALYDWVPPKAS